MSYIFNTGAVRPNRLTSVKNESYHRDFAKFCLTSMNNHLYRQFINKCLVNWSFFKGQDGQWIFEEDVESFFLDESGDLRNRLKWTKNVIKPMVQQYVGNAIRLSYDATATCITSSVINKREADLKMLKGYEKVAELYPFFKQMIKDNTNVQDTPIETEELFLNTFVEDYGRDINNLMEVVAEEININEIKTQLARNLALCGLTVYKGGESSDNYVGDSLNPLFYFWDMSAKKQDLSDAEHMGDWYYMDAPSLFEKYPKMSNTERTAVENYGRGSNNNSMHKIINGIYTQPSGKVPVYEVYWKDCEKREYGWVLDDYGYPFYSLINHGDSKYTDKHLIEPVTDAHKEEMGDSKKVSIYLDILRYAIMIPQEEIACPTGDIILEYGIAKYQEKNLYDPSNVKFPYKAYAWVYDRGEVLTPLDDVIDPQRFLNRTLSVVESQMSNMRGTGTVISKSAVDDRDGEAETNRNINASKPIYVDTDRVGSVQNAIGTYGSNIGSGTLEMFSVIKTVENSIQDVTGVNDAMAGTQGGADVLVGVVEAQIQRGSLVQEPFYWGLTSVLKQIYEQIATVGKMIYFDNPRKLAIMVGDRGFQNIAITEDNLLQDFRIFVKRSESKEQGVSNGNTLLWTLLQGQLIDQKIFANLFNRSNPEQIADALRQYHKEKTQAENMANKQAIENESEGKVQASKMQSEADEMNQQAIMIQQDMEQLEHERELEKIDAKGNQKLKEEVLKTVNTK